MTAAAHVLVGQQLPHTCGWGGGNDGCRLYLGVCGDADRCPYADDAP